MKNLPPPQKIVLVIFFFCFNYSMFSQNSSYYCLEIKEQHDLGVVQTSTNTDQTLAFTMSNTGFATLLNTNPVYTFEKAFPTSQTPRLQRVYLLSISENFPYQDILDRIEVERFFLIDENENLLSSSPPFIIPNDYNDIITPDERNSSLDLVKAPLAWTLSTGQNVLVGVDDAAASLIHDDLDGQFFDTILIGSHPDEVHGVGVSGVIAAKTNNNSHIASVAHDSKIVFVHTTGGSLQLINGLLQLSQYPNIKVINCSWAMPEGYWSLGFLDDAMNEINAQPNPPLIVAAAGNDGDAIYNYPASYDSTISVTTVGNRFPIGFDHNFSFDHPSGNVWQIRSWKDVHLLRPHISGNTSSHNHNDKVDVCAPGQLTTNITNDYINYPGGYKTGGATSTATPWVSAVAALIYSINPNFTAAQVKEIIRNTADDIYHIPYNQDYIGLLGTGRINAYRAALKAQCTVSPSTRIDLAMQNSNLDYFVEPDVNTQQVWRSDDIWVRNQNDGNLIDVHENPEYDPVDPNYAYVRVTNNSCVTSSGNDQLKLYWAKANASLTWPDHWEGDFYMQDPITLEYILMGDEVGTLGIPPLEIGESKILEFEWYVPNPEDYINIDQNNPWHFCLLARIESTDDPMTFPEVSNITTNVKNNNNIAWKNMTVVDFDPNAPSSPIGAVVAVGNPTNQAKSYNLELVKEIDEPGKALYDEAEVAITMDATIYNAWNAGGETSTNFQATLGQNNRIIVENDHALIENVQLGANEIGTVYVSFNFLTKELTDKTKFVYHLVQRDAVTNEVIGGETFEVRKQPRPIFDADAGSDEEIDINETITIAAEDINETATYNWYDPNGNLIHTGIDLTVTPSITQIYQLEIVSVIDGFKDYDEVQVTVNPYKIESLIPNPTSSQVTVNYLADGAVSAYIMIVNTITGNSDNYILDVLTSATTIDVSSLSTGLYNVILVCDGEIQNSKNLIKQ